MVRRLQGLGHLKSDEIVVLLRGDSWIFGPEADYERGGDVHDVVFPCGHTISPDGDTINTYYGAGDSCIALAQGNVSSLLSWLERNGKPSGVDSWNR